MDENNVRFIGIGFDSRFVKPFVQEGFFSGELYLDKDMECYKALNYQRFSFFDLMKRLLSFNFKTRKAKADGMNIKGDMKGDGFQNGGALIVDKGGKQIFEYIQEDASIQITEEQILNALKISQ